MVNNCHLLLHFTKKNVPYLTKHLHFPADLLSYVLCHSAGWFPALHQQLPCHLIPLLFLLLSGGRVMSPRERWADLQLKTWGIFFYPKESGSTEHVFFCNKFVFISSKAILTLELLPPIRPGKSKRFFPGLNFRSAPDMKKVMQVNASFISFVQIRHLAVWPLLYTLNPLVHVCIIASEGNST